MHRVELLQPIQLPLVNKFYRHCHYSAKAGRGEQVFVVRGPDSEGREDIVAAVRLQQRAKGWYFLRSMCVQPELRGGGEKGLGSLLLQGLSGFLQQHPTYCFPFDHLQHFYARAGFVSANADAMPEFALAQLMRYQRQGRKIILMSYNNQL